MITRFISCLKSTERTHTLYRPYYKGQEGNWPHWARTRWGAKCDGDAYIGAGGEGRFYAEGMPYGIEWKQVTFREWLLGRPDKLTAHV